MTDVDTAVRFPVPPVVKQVTIAKPASEVFRLFTAEIDKWWPLSKGYKVGQAAPIFCAIEPRVGGRLFERAADGRESDWGRVLVWDPPHALTYTFHPGRPGEESPPKVEMRFVAETDARTRVELVHTGWESTPEGQERREAFNRGWVHVFEECFAGFAAR